MRYKGKSYVMEIEVLHSHIIADSIKMLCLSCVINILHSFTHLFSFRELTQI
jgi:hypothetical protein